MEKIVFFKTEWMTEYDGDITSLGMTYDFVIEQGFGHEIYNFRKINESVYGYVQVNGKIKIERLGALKTDENIDNVTVVWLAKNPEKGGVYIVGWYLNAKIYREVKIQEELLERIYNGKVLGYNVSAKFVNAKLLPINQRIKKIPKGIIRQINVWYANNNLEFIEEVKAYISSFYVDKDELEQNELVDILKDKPKPELLNELFNDTEDGNEKIPLRGKTYKRNNSNIAKIKLLRGFHCQICGKSIIKKDGSKYVEAAHIKDKPNGGKELWNNIILLCPNHHKEFDIGKREIILHNEEIIKFKIEDDEYSISFEINV